jgi:AcrR family transcriptional regulator
MPAAPKRPARLAPEQRRAQLLDATLRLAARAGFTGMTVEAVAREAGVTRPVIYDLFGDLDGLLDALGDREEARAMAALARVIPDDPGERDPEAVLVDAVGGYLEAVRDEPATWRLVLLPPSGSPPALRDRMRRNIMATMLFSQGMPMLLMGDEIGRTQKGNNNAYCQDNEIAWTNWKGAGARDEAFLEFVRGLIRLRKRYRILHYPHYLHGEPIDEKGTRSVVWLRPDGREMDPPSWGDPNAKVVGLLLSDRSTRLMIVVNSYHLPISFKLPDGEIHSWTVRVDTATGEIDPPNRTLSGGGSFELTGRTLLLLVGATA